MLINSDRHTENDLLLWREHQAADLIHARSTAFRIRVAEAINAIVAFRSPDPVCYCGTSWGKDSTVVCHLLLCAGVDVPLIHLRPSNHNPDCDSVRDSYLSRFHGQSYSEVHVDYSKINRFDVPQAELDKQTDRIWNAAIRESGKPFEGRHILGIRSEESGGREIRTARWGLNSPNGCAPIARWTSQDVFSYLTLHDLPIHPAYAMLGNGRWPRNRIRVAELADTHGAGGGRSEWEMEYYGDEIRRMMATSINRSA